MLLIHILAGLAAITAGMTALFVTKGSPLHSRAGHAFVVAMLAMAGSAVWLAIFEVPSRVNTVAALLTIYLVCTAVLTVALPVDRQRGMLAGLMAGAFGLGLWALHSGAAADGAIDGDRAGVLFVFGTVALAGALFDARLLLAGTIAGTPRLRRHLWRMGFAMFMATASLFLGQPGFFPPALQSIGLRAVPVLIVVVIPAYWLVRLAVRRRPRREPVQ